MVPQYIPFPILILNSLARENIKTSAAERVQGWIGLVSGVRPFYGHRTATVFIRGPFIVRYPDCPNSPAEVTNFVESVRWPVGNQSPVAALHGRGAAFGP